VATADGAAQLNDLPDRESVRHCFDPRSESNVSEVGTRT